jgi:hypothetical protein
LLYRAGGPFSCWSTRGLVLGIIVAFFFLPRAAQVPAASLTFFITKDVDK